jgi:DNA phosphorothioation-associated putative methyltransferase
VHVYERTEERYTHERFLSTSPLFRPALSQLPRGLRADIRAFFGTYAKACRQADELLFRVGDASAIDEACTRAPVGKLLPDDLYVHHSAVDALGPLLRIYDGCGRAYLGEVEGANISKIHRRSGKISYLVYPDFESDPHPALLRCIRLSLRTRELHCYEYGDPKKGTGTSKTRSQSPFSGSANPPILHRKETFLTPDHPLHAKVCPTDAAGGAARAARGDGDDRHAGGMAGTASGGRPDAVRAPRGAWRMSAIADRDWLIAVAASAIAKCRVAAIQSKT